MSTAYWLNTLWAQKCRREASRFVTATRSVDSTQSNLLRRILARNQASRYGKRFRFAQVRTAREFREQVPTTCYEDYQDAVAQIADGESNVLTGQGVRLLEPTSGTTGGEKLIPYTADLRKQFQRAVDTWIHNLMTCRPEVRKGTAYWSISPCLGATRKTAGGIPIGFDDDVSYLGRWEQMAVRRLLAVPSSVANVPNIENFRYATLLHLLHESDLALVSIWSPTFLTALLDQVEHWVDRICHDIEHGTVSWPAPDHASRAYMSLRKSANRARQLRAAWNDSTTTAEFLATAWPRLQLISCWTDAAAGQFIPSLRELFPEVEIQPKGLLATEAFVSIPLCDRLGSALAVRSHFFEFEPCDSTDASGNRRGPTRLAHELEQERQYRVVVTTGGGLYRYRLGDLIEVVGYENQCPLIRLLGRVDKVSDLVGEKLAELHVRDVLQGAFTACLITPVFAMLIAQPLPTAHYRLLVQPASGQCDDGMANRLRNLVESGLMENPYYRHALSMRQLAPMAVELLDPAAASYWKRYEDACVARGQKVGDIKPTVMADANWLDDVPGN